MRSARQISWLILATSAVFLALGIYDVLSLYIASLVHLPGGLEAAARAIQGAEGLDALKSACLSLTVLTEEERMARAAFVVRAGWMSVALALLCGALSWRLLVALRRSDGNGQRQ
jgi:hypothetical protein